MSQQSSLIARFIELDVIRGVAVIAMVLYHTYFFGWWLGWGWAAPDGLFVLCARLIPVTFLVLVGMGLELSFHRSPEGFLRRSFRKVVVLAVVAGLVTIGSWLFARPYTIYFGILQCIGVVTAVVAVLLSKKVSSILLFVTAIFSLGLGLLFRNYFIERWWGIPFGLRPEEFSTLDYFPLFPWMGFAVVGVLLARWLYVRDENRATVISLRHWLQSQAWASSVAWIGRHALAIYVFQPAFILLLLWLVRSVTILP